VPFSFDAAVNEAMAIGWFPCWSCGGDITKPFVGLGENQEGNSLSVQTDFVKIKFGKFVSSPPNNDNLLDLSVSSTSSTIKHSSLVDSPFFYTLLSSLRLYSSPFYVVFNIDKLVSFVRKESTEDNEIAN
jgi:hypothetical protein